MARRNSFAGNVANDLIDAGLAELILKEPKDPVAAKRVIVNMLQDADMRNGLIAVVTNAEQDGIIDSSQAGWLRSTIRQCG